MAKAEAASAPHRLLNAPKDGRPRRWVGGVFYSPRLPREGEDFAESRRDAFASPRLPMRSDARRSGPRQSAFLAFGSARLAGPKLHNVWRRGQHALNLSRQPSKARRFSSR
jgi:hypothetical protein